MNYISVKGALVKSNTWDLGKKSRRGHGEESPMCAVVIEMPCLRLSQRRPSFSHFMFANKGFSVKKVQCDQGAHLSSLLLHELAHHTVGDSSSPWSVLGVSFQL